MSSTRAAVLRSRLAIDLRSLALLRAGLGAVLLCDALCRLCSAALLYSDAGLLPRAAAAALIEPARISLHLANGSALFALALTLVQALAASALIFGWRTRVAALLCWLLAVSAAARNPLVVTAGDALAIALLSWGLFLPLNARWSVDAAPGRRAHDPTTHVSIAGVVLLAQALCLFLFAALAQPGAMQMPSVRFVPDAVPLAAALWWMLLLVMPLGLLSLLDGRQGLLARRLALGLMLLLCVLGIVALGAGTLPWLALCATLIWIDSGLWERVDASAASTELRIFHTTDDARARSLALLLRELLCLRRTVIAAAQDSARAARLMQPGTRLVVFDRNDTAHLDGAALRALLRDSSLLRPLRGVLAGGAALALCERLLPALLRCGCEPQGRSLAPTFGHSRGAQILVAILGLWVALAQVGPRNDASGLNRTLRAGLSPFGLDHDWTWRGAGERTTWMALPGELSDDREVDARSPDLSAPRFGIDQPPLVQGWRGKVYGQRVLEPGAGPARVALAQHLCAQRGSTLAGLRVVMMVPSPDAASAAVEQRVLLRHECR